MADALQSERNERSDPPTVSSQLLVALLSDLKAFPLDEDVDAGSSPEAQIKVWYNKFKALVARVCICLEQAS